MIRAMLITYFPMPKGHDQPLKAHKSGKMAPVWNPRQIDLHSMGVQGILQIRATLMAHFQRPKGQGHTLEGLAKWENSLLGDPD